LIDKKTQRFLTLTLLISYFVFSQNKVEFQRLLSSNAAPQSITYNVKQDSIGQLWIASEEGVIKYNSKDYKIYNSFKGLPKSVGDKANTLFVDSNKKLWVGLINGVSYYDKNLDVFKQVVAKGKITPTIVSSITEDVNGDIWIGGYNGLWRFKNDSITRELSKYKVQSLYNDGSNLFIGTDKGLYHYKPKNRKVTEIRLNNLNPNIKSINIIDDKILIGTKTGDLWQINKSNYDNAKIVFKSQSKYPIRDVIKIKSSIYVATDGDGLFQLDTKYDIKNHYKENSDNPNAIFSNGIYDLEEGTPNLLWITTYGGGVNYIDNNKLSYNKIQHQINNPNSIASNFTRAIAKDKNGNIWFGTKQGVSVWLVKKNIWKHFSNLDGKKGNKKDIVLGLQSDNNYMWVGTYNNGLFKVEINNFKIIPFTDKSKVIPKIYSIYKDSKSNIWVGGIEGDLIVIRKNNTTNRYPIHNIRSITETKDGEILAAGRDGVYIINDILKNYNLINDLKPNLSRLPYVTINAVTETADKKIIVATNGAGLLFYDRSNEKVNKLSIENRMPSNNIQGLIVKNDSLFWASTTRGLVRINIKKKDTIIHVFNKKDGLASTEYNYGSYAKLSNKKYAFGGVEGVTLFNPNKIPEHGETPNIVLEELKLFDTIVPIGSDILEKHINLENKIILKNNQNFIELHYVGVLQGVLSNGMKYVWKLEGFTKNWSKPTERTFVSFSNLDPGNYTFRVKGINKFGDVGKEKKLKIVILKPWYATLLAYFIYALILLGMILGVVYFITSLTQKKKLDAQIDFFNNITHEIKTPLSILISNLDKISNDMVKDNDNSVKRIRSTVKRINSLFEQLLTFHRVTSQKIDQNISKINLEEEIEHLKISFKPLLDKKKLKVRINNNWDKQLFYHDKAIFDKIISNLFSNAVKYCFEGETIDISLNKSKDNDLKISIKDRGLGIPKDQQKYILNRFYRARNVINSQKPGTGLGLILVKKILDKTGGSISFESEENIGTTFIVYLKNLNNEFKANTTSPITYKDFKQEGFSKIDPELVKFKDSKILIVEDNDELRELLVNSLSVYFQVYDAKNGAEGLELARQIFPDVILTDLVMPKMDGMQMAKKIKEDINLNHIPVFMMTVLNNFTHKLESAKVGINTFIEKPIDLPYLLAKLIGTLKWQKKLRKKYVFDNDVENAQSYRSEQDQKFIQQLEKCVIDNVDNEDFSVLVLSQSFGMSRTSLYMKLKNLVDLSPQDFIIHTKLKYAKKLLIEGNMSIKEVAYNSGFSNPKYFSTTFKKYFKMTPSAFLDSLKKE